MMTASPMLVGATSWAFQNLAVFPCREKKPLTAHGFKDASMDAAVIAGWWTQWPDAQIGIPTGEVNHLFVLDVDGPDGEAIIVKLNLPETYTVETRPGRRQFYFRQPDGVKTKTDGGVLGPQLDRRGDGAYVIGPPSVHHETGQPYRVVKDLPWAEMPPVLNDIRANGHALTTVLTTDIIPKGKRHQTLLSVAGALRARGLSPQSVLATLRTVNAQRCQPPIDEADLQRLATFVGTKPAGFPGQRLVETSAEIELESFSQIAPGEVHWLWRDRVALGKLNLFVGLPGEGKSLGTLGIAARVSRGHDFPDGAPCETGDVIILSSEDGAADTIRPRLDAASADISRVHRIKAVKITLADGGKGEAVFSLERDIERLDEALAKNPKVRLLVIDPLSAYLGKVDMWKDSEVRRVLTPLAELADRRRIAVLAIMHLNKSQMSALLRIGGSIAFVAAARVVWGFGKHPDVPETRVMVPIKNNLAPLGNGLPYRIEAKEKVPYIVWEETPIAVDANDVLAPDLRGGSEERSTRAEAIEWLKSTLEDGAQSVTALQEQAKKDGLAWRTIQRAKSALPIRTYKLSIAGGWAWELQQPSRARGA